MTFDTIKTIIAKQFKIPESAIFEDSRIFDDLKFDSLDAVELIIAIEEHYQIELTGSEADNVTTIKEIVEIVKSKL